MSTLMGRLRIVLPFVGFAALLTVLTFTLAPENSAWFAGLPWALLLVFWGYLAILARRGERLAARLKRRPPAI